MILITEGRQLGVSISVPFVQNSRCESESGSVREAVTSKSTVMALAGYRGDWGRNKTSAQALAAWDSLKVSVFRPFPLYCHASVSESPVAPFPGTIYDLSYLSLASWSASRFACAPHLDMITDAEERMTLAKGGRKSSYNPVDSGSPHGRRQNRAISRKLARSIGAVEESSADATPMQALPWRARYTRSKTRRAIRANRARV